jgi:O-antigen/teichoic acid export membrane protein
LAWGSMWYACTVLLGLFYTDASVGWFGASHRGLMALHTFVSLYFFNLLPSIARCSVLPQKHLLELMDQSVRLAAWTGLFGAALLTALAPQIMTLVYGPAFRPAALSFVVLVWMLPIAMLSGHHRFILIAYKRQRDLLRCSVISAVSAVVLGGALIPRFGGPGAAWALLMAIAINFVLVYLAVRRWVVEVPVHRQLARPIAALVVAALVYFALLERSEWLAVAGGCTIYGAGLLWSDGRRLASFLKALVRGAATKQPKD